MKDLTKDSITNHLLSLAAPVLAGMVTQIAYQVVDLYFITRIGAAATAGVNAAGNATFVVAALAAMLNMGAAPLIAHAVGRKDQADVNAVFNQSLALSIVLGAFTAILLYLCNRWYMQSVAADAATVEAGVTFILWMLPGLALICPMAGLGAALRGSGTVRPSVVVSMLTVIVNALLAPVLIAGWGTGLPLGVKGAGLATSLSIVVGIVLLAAYFYRYERYLKIQLPLLRPRLAQWRRVIAIGLPASGEFVVTFLSMTVTYFAIRSFGTSVQAGFGIGSRILQVAVLPAMAIGFAVGPIAAQNFGANNVERVRRTLREAVLMSIAVMIVTAVLVRWHAHALVSMFDTNAATLAAAVLFLELMSWTLVAQGLVYICSSMFQALGHTVPALISSGARFVVFFASIAWLSAQDALSPERVWHLLIASMVLQALVSAWLLRMELRRGPSQQTWHAIVTRDSQ